MTSISRPRIPPALLISAMANAVPRKCSDSVIAISPLRENSTPTRQASRSACFARGPVFVTYPPPAASTQHSVNPEPVLRFTGALATLRQEDESGFNCNKPSSIRQGTRTIISFLDDTEHPALQARYPAVRRCSQRFRFLPLSC